MIRAPLRLWHKKSERRASQLSRSLSAIGRGSLNSRTLRILVFFENSVSKPLRIPDFFKRFVLNALRAEHPLRQLAKEGQIPQVMNRTVTPFKNIMRTRISVSTSSSPKSSRPSRLSSTSPTSPSSSSGRSSFVPDSSETIAQSMERPKVRPRTSSDFSIRLLSVTSLMTGS